METIDTTRKLVSTVEILKRLKEIFEIKKGLDLAKIFDVKPNTVSSWKMRNAIPYHRVMEVCGKHNISLNELFYESFSNDNIEIDHCKIPILYIENHWEYYFNKNNVSLQQAYFPKDIGFDIIIQLPVGNTLELDSEIIYTYCKKINIDNLVENEEYIFLIKAKGFKHYTFLTRDSHKGKLHLLSKGRLKHTKDQNDIIEVFHCKGIYKNKQNHKF